MSSVFHQSSCTPEPFTGLRPEVLRILLGWPPAVTTTDNPELTPFLPPPGNSSSARFRFRLWLFWADGLVLLGSVPLHWLRHRRNICFRTSSLRAQRWHLSASYTWQIFIVMLRASTEFQIIIPVGWTLKTRGEHGKYNTRTRCFLLTPRLLGSERRAKDQF